MLVLTRKEGESIRIGDDIEIVVRRLSGNRVALAVEAPRDVRILRGELTQFDDSTETREADRAQTASRAPRAAKREVDYAVIESRIPRAYFQSVADEFIS